MFRWGKRLGICLLCSFTVPLLAGIPDQWTTNRDESQYPPLGEMVDVGGYQLHLYRSGSGGPAVIIDNGLGGISSDWSLVQAEMAKFTQVVSYDRAGNAWSESSPFPRTSQQIVQELHTLLKNAHIAPPYILVGHSFGGNNVQLYAATYPDEVAGLVLVDSCHEEQITKLPLHPLWDLIKLRQNPGDANFISTFGSDAFVVQMYLKIMLPLIPESMQNMHSALSATTKNCSAISDEMKSLAESLKQLASIDRSLIRNTPCIVLTAGGEEGLAIFGASEAQMTAMQERKAAYEAAWQELQKDLVSKFNGSLQIIAEKSNHMIHWKQPELIVQAVKQLVDENNELGGY